MENKEIYRQIILDHSKRPLNFGILEEMTLVNHLKNPSCGDDIKVGIIIEENELVNIKEECVGCSICKASSSIMTVELEGMTIDAAIKKIENFKSNIKNGSVDEEEFEDANALSGVSKFPARLKCANLPWEAVLELIKNNRDKNET